MFPVTGVNQLPGTLGPDFYWLRMPSYALSKYLRNHKYSYDGWDKYETRKNKRFWNRAQGWNWRWGIHGHVDSLNRWSLDPLLRWISDSFSKCSFWKIRTISKTKTVWKLGRNLGWDSADDWTASTSVQFRYVFINLSYLASYKSSKRNLWIKWTNQNWWEGQVSADQNR